MKVAILYRAILTKDLSAYLIGGVESYVWALAQLCLDEGFEPVVFQLSDEYRKTFVRGIQVVGVGHWTDWDNVGAVGQILSDASEAWRAGDEGITIFALDHFSVPSANPRSIVIQHGIEFDIPLPANPAKETPAKRTARVLLESHPIGRRFLMKRLEAMVTARSAKFRRHFDQVPYRVCVDHNYVNWYRTQAGYVGLDNYWVIPNFCRPIPQSEFDVRVQTPPGKRILYARRFVPYRGCRLMMEVVPRILDEHPEASFTFAGEGPLELELRDLAAREPRVRVTRYDPGQEGDLLKCHDISVIPSLGSEGTTLAVAEAMGAGCVVVATDVGGMTNMVLNGFNGVLVSPTVVSIELGILSLFDKPELHRQYAESGYAVATKCFAIDKWKRRWSEVLEVVARHPRSL